MKIKVTKPRSRGGFLHKYYCHMLKELAEATWQGCAVKIEDGSQGKYADVTVKMVIESAEEKQRVIAFEVFMTEEAKEIRGLAKCAEVFDRIIVCSESKPAMDSLRNRAVNDLGQEIRSKIQFNLISRYLGHVSTNGADRTNGKSHRQSFLPLQKGKKPNRRAPHEAGSDLDIEVSQEQTLLKNRAKLRSSY